MRGAGAGVNGRGVVARNVCGVVHTWRECGHAARCFIDGTRIVENRHRLCRHVSAMFACPPLTREQIPIGCYANVADIFSRKRPQMTTSDQYAQGKVPFTNYVIAVARYSRRGSRSQSSIRGGGIRRN